jgi:3-phenylpropionate/trans-cinnamate dioxygenase ferredoxin reductase subunit
VIRGDAGKRQFISFWIKDGRVLAGMNVNVWDVTEPVQKLITARVPVDTQALADPHVPLDGLLP